MICGNIAQEVFDMIQPRELQALLDHVSEDARLSRRAATSVGSRKNRQDATINQPAHDGPT